MSKSKISLIIVLILLVISNVFLGVRYFFVAKELRKTQNVLEIQRTNDKVVEFTKLFIDEVLKTDKEVNFETRLKLENSVRGLDDAEILNIWSKFVESKTESEAQIEVKNLLGTLINKIGQS